MAPLLSEPAPGTVDGDAGPVVANIRENRRALLDAAILATAGREASEPPVRRRDHDGHGEVLKRIAALLLEEGVSRWTRMELWQARRNLLEVGFYGCRYTGEDADVLRAALETVATAEGRLAAAAARPGPG